MTKEDPSGERDALSINPTLKPGAEDQSAKQGPAPDHLEERPASGAPVPDTHGQQLSAQEVERMMGGGDASMTEANMALGEAEGLDPCAED